MRQVSKREIDERDGKMINLKFKKASVDVESAMYMIHTECYRYVNPLGRRSVSYLYDIFPGISMRQSRGDYPKT